MEKFKYYVKDKQGASKNGIIEAVDIKQASSLLHERGLVVIKLTPKDSGFNPLGFIRSLRPVTLTEFANFTRQLSTMISAGLSLIDSLLLLERQTSNPKLKAAISEIIRDVQGGGSLAKAMGRQDKVFSNMYVNMIKAAESSGNLDKILVKLAESLEKENEVKSKVVGAMIYPVILLVVMVGVVMLISTFVLPRFKEMFASNQIELPLPTQILIFFSDFLNNTWYFIPAALLAFLLILYRLKRVNELRIYFDYIIMNIPYLGEINRSFSLAQATRTLGLLVGSGVPIINALKTSAEVASNSFHKTALLEAAEAVEKGVPLNVPLSKNPIFPPVISQMVAVGEETGKLEEVLTKVSEFFENEAEHRVKNFTAALGPIIIIVLAVAILFILIAVIIPIYQLTTDVAIGS